MDLESFARALAELTVDDIRSIACDLAEANTSTADEIAATRSVLLIEQTLRRTHRLHNAATAALQTASAVQDVAHAARVKLPDADVTRVARAAAQLARGMVAAECPGVDEALRVLSRGWQRLPCYAELAA